MRFLSMSRKIIFIIVFFSVIYVAYAQEFVGLPSGQEQIPPLKPILEKEVLDLVNQLRTKNKLSALAWNNDLARAARYHAKDMSVDNYVEHETYDLINNQLVLICTPFARIEKFICFPYLAENISAGKSSASETVKAWMTSQGHRNNILNKNYKFTGIGYYFDSNKPYVHYWVQVFGGD